MAPQMAQLIQHIESFVDSTSPATKQASSVDAITILLKNDSISVQQLVKELEMYLTTTDSVLRARGILLLADVLGRLAAKPLDSRIVHSLIQFFSEKLTDWRASRGALVGCLALLKRKDNVGRVSISDAKAVGQSYLKDLPVQSLGQTDRKLCYEFLLCMLEHYSEAVAELGEEFVYGIYEAIDGEKDPQCLMLVFHIVEVLSTSLFNPAGPMTSFAGEIVDILGRYFPIHYTHPRGEDVAVSRDDLSRTLMLAFSSSPLFEPFAIPLFLEKLSSSLPVAKIDSLRYLGSCTVKYGPDRMAKHAEPIWKSIKSAICSFTPEPSLSSFVESSENVVSQYNEIVGEALNLLKIIIREMNDVLFDLILGDDITSIVNSISSFRSYYDLSLEDKQKLFALGQILPILVKSSSSSCNRVFETLLPRLSNSLKIFVDGSSGDSLNRNGDISINSLNFGAHYLWIQILGACKDFAVDSMKHTSLGNFIDDPWCRMLEEFSSSLMKSYGSVLDASKLRKSSDEHFTLTLKGFQCLASFPGGFSIVSKSIFEQVLVVLVSIILAEFSIVSSWKSALKVLVHVGSFVNENLEPEKSESYSATVLERIITLVSMDDPTVPYPMFLEAVSSIGTTGPAFAVKVFQAIEEAVMVKFSRIDVDGDPYQAGILVELLRCCSLKLLPWFLERGGFEEILLRFSVHIFDRIIHCQISSDVFKEQDILCQTMVALKLAVAGCSIKDQNIIVQKAAELLSLCESSSFMLHSSLTAVSAQLEVTQLTQNLDKLTCRHEWFLSLFASVIIAIRPETFLPSTGNIVETLLVGLSRGHVPSAQALGSLFNKGHQNLEASSYNLEDVLGTMSRMIFGSTYENLPLQSSWIPNGNEPHLIMVPVSSLQTDAICGLAWIGKGLIMRGHENIKDVVAILWRCILLTKGSENPSDQESGSVEPGKENLILLKRTASDAFHILLSDSEDCLTKEFHAISRPLYKQRLFSILLPILLSAIRNFHSSDTRLMLYRVFGHVLSDVPLVAVLYESKKIVPALLDALLMLTQDESNKDMVYNLLLVLSGILMEENGKETITENAHIIVNCLTGLLSYPYKMSVRETAIQCLVAMSTVSYSRIYPLRTQVQRALTKVLDDPKRSVRQEAVRCRQIWS